MNVLDIQLPQAVNHNQTIEAISRRVFTFCNEDFYCAVEDKKSAVWAQLNITFMGQELKVYVNQAMLNAALADLSLSLDQMSEDAIALWLVSNFSKMPAQLRIHGIEMKDDIPSTVCVGAYSYKNRAELGWQIAWDETGFPIKPFLESLNGFCKGLMPPVYAKLPIALPLVACAISIPATEAQNLQVGDVLILGGA